MYEWATNVSNTIVFVMVDTSGTEVTGLGASYTLELRKPGGSFAASAGTKSEIANGWYQYVSTAGEADTAGSLAIRVTGAGCAQQNLVAMVGASHAGFGATSKTLTINDGSNPLDGVEVWLTTDSAGSNKVASGITDALGQVTFYLDAGTYYVWQQIAGYEPGYVGTTTVT